MEQKLVTTTALYHSDDTKRKISELTSEMNVWHELIMQPYVKAFGGDCAKGCDDPVNHTATQELKRFDKTLLRGLSKEGYETALLICLSEWDGDELSKSYFLRLTSSVVNASINTTSQNVSVH